MHSHNEERISKGMHARLSPSPSLLPRAGSERGLGVSSPWNTNERLCLWNLIFFLFLQEIHSTRIKIPSITKSAAVKYIYRYICGRGKPRFHAGNVIGCGMDNTVGKSLIKNLPLMHQRNFRNPLQRAQCIVQMINFAIGYDDRSLWSLRSAIVS